MSAGIQDSPEFGKREGGDTMREPAAAGGAAEGESDVNKLKHLEMIQGVINRMAANSFLIKGWCVTLVGAIIALASKDADRRFIAVAYYPVFMFWLLDGFFLNQEQLYRNLYDAVRLKQEAAIDFSMDAKTVPPPAGEKKPTWPRALFSRTLLLFYGVMVGAILLSMLIVLRYV
jgi:hypothetical protein